MTSEPMVEVEERVVRCTRCDWVFPVLTGDDIGRSDELADILWRGTAIIHALVKHPAEQSAATGHHPEQRLAYYRERYGPTVFAALLEWATTTIDVSDCEQCAEDVTEP